MKRFVTILFAMATIITIAPLANAVDRISDRTPVGSTLRTAEWEDVPLALRDRALFSAGIEEMRVLGTVKNGLGEIAGHLRSEHGVLTDRSKLIADIGKVAREAGLTPTDPDLIGTLQDITSERRGALIVDTQMQMAYGYSDWKTGQDKDALDAFPAQELVRIAQRKIHRDWQRKFVEKGGELKGPNHDRMIALKTDKIWERLSRFGTPWPPLDFGSGMGFEDVSREETIGFGLLAPGQLLTPSDQDFNSRLVASKSEIGDEGFASLKQMFGDQIRFQGDEIKWHGQIVQELFDAALADPTFKGSTRLGLAPAATVELGAEAGANLQGAELHLTADEIRHAYAEHGPTELRADQAPLTRFDFEMLPHLWRNPDSITAGTQPNTWVFRKEYIGKLYSVVWKRSEEESARNVYGVKTLYKKVSA